jgi:predicted RND superfamily exporter protein
MGYGGIKVASEVWVQAVTDSVITKGIVWGILMSAIFALVAIYIFTGSVVITTLSVFTMGCINVLVLGLYYVLGWKLGAIEGVSITVLLGLCVDYCIHFSEAFVASPLDYRRDKAKCVILLQ